MALRGNRARSGCAASPCQSLDFLGLGRGFSCDEFPFASSVEGGYDAFLRCIPSNENKVQGGLIGGFYRQNSLKPNGQDKYKIAVQNADKLRYCDDNVPGGCANDGQQFHTQWRLNKRGIEEQTPMLVPDVPGSDEGLSNVTMPAPLRKFVTAGGVELWLLARNITDDVVGEEVWLDWNRTHPDVIVQEITELPFDR
ncbi:hypothetical protein BJX66DRAFT_339089 [Aspergillus keveii]|uniref:Deoxyribonuclease NucA/NucB domain-containing protein n=1 Tax=Aspergillus keveii TaxID=714993 RepID=A0ABR4G2J9_9EURO